MAETAAYSQPRARAFGSLMSKWLRASPAKPQLLLAVLSFAPQVKAAVPDPTTQLCVACMGGARAESAATQLLAAGYTNVKQASPRSERWGRVLCLVRAACMTKGSPAVASMLGSRSERARAPDCTDSEGAKLRT